MTNEEAKEIFLNRGFVNGLFDGDKWRQSIVVISKWLEQEPCEDCISRADARHLIAEVNRKTLGCISTKAFKTLYKGIDELPSVTPKPKTDFEDCISRKAVKEFVEYIQTIKDKHNDEGLPINYGTICGLVILGWKLIESEDKE